MNRIRIKLNEGKKKKDQIELLRKIALKVRSVCSDFAQSSSEKYDFSGSEDLACMCAAASQILYNALKKHEIEPIAVMGISDNLGDHVWVEVGNYIIDVTYTQYNKYVDDVPISFPAVIVIDKDSKEARELYYNEFTERLIRKDISDILDGWPKGQIFDGSTIKRLLMRVEPI